MDGKELREVQDLNYLGSHIACTESDIRARIGKAWKGLNDMNKMWRSNMSRGVKLSSFKATVEFVLLHGGETLTLTPILTKS